ncbi:hypothetical protein C483_00380 [Natrialba hulunbeirensis JCM 10989]|uniref:Uncharacterized protein n=1 Tax=Natrialba hulunbeirensis JCM 10989 TaxID=1227493 RepID=M0ACW2_9EURY|nr:hypothetical protein C483_00380 [Natrialba hulunbeirensis JCM 10989]
MVDIARSRARAKVAFGLSALMAAAAVGWFWYRGDPVTGILLGGLLMGGGYWEFRRRLVDVRRAARAESDVENDTARK